MNRASNEPRNEVLSRALQQIRSLRHELELVRGRAGDSVAVTGMACRLPGGVQTPGQLWDMLAEGKDGLIEVPASRWRAADFYDPDPEMPGKTNVLRAGFVADVDRFDAKFFGVSAREAAWMDPQQRLFLEVAWEALECAGETPDSVASSRTGVFLGVTGADYTTQQMQKVPCEQLEAYSGTGLTSTFAPGRLAHWLGATGPCLAIDTSCSSSLVAVHIACQSLKSGDCDMAIVGGTNLLLMPEVFVMLSKAGMLSPDGRCKTFDKSADGYARGEGICAIVLKRARDAESQQDTIWALLRGSAINHDGRSSGLTVPNVKAQAALITDALTAAGTRPEEIGYLEAHGTGTPLGDPIEIEAVSNALCAGRRVPLVVASLKANIGHLEAAAGLAGLIKTILVVNKGRIPPHVGMAQINPDVATHSASIVFPDALLDWPDGGGQSRIAGVSSFGASGTNAHVVVQEPAKRLPSAKGPDRTTHVLVLSAMSEAALRRLVSDYIVFLNSPHDKSWADICFTAAACRAHFSFRLAVVAGSCEECTRALGDYLEGRSNTALIAGKAAASSSARICFLFTGQGSQYVGMARQLLDSSPSFRKDLEHCHQACQKHAGIMLLDAICGTSGPGDIQRTLFSQPALFAVEYALARQWIRWGVRPALVLGHSVGEYAAACIAGGLDVDDALKAICLRARLMEALPIGAMATVHATREEVISLIESTGSAVSIAAVNGERLIGVSGRVSAVDRVVEAAKQRGFEVQRMKVERAFHSAEMESIRSEFQDVARQIAPGPLQVPMVAAASAELFKSGDSLQPEYWATQLREPVLFRQALQRARDERPTVFLEVGPRATLTRLVRNEFGVHEGHEGHEGHDQTMPAYASLLGKGDDWKEIATALANLYVSGVPIDWRAFDGDYQRQKVVLPTYPFEPKTFWLSEGGMQSTAPRPQLQPFDGGETSLAGRRINLPRIGHQLALTLDARVHETLDDCVAHERAIVNVGFYLEMMFASAESIDASEAKQVSDLVVRRALFMPESRRVAICNTLVPDAKGWQFEAHTQEADAADEWALLVTGHVACSIDPASARCGWQLPALSQEQAISGDAFYSQLTDRGIRLGPSARWIDAIWRGDGEAWCRFRRPRASEQGRYGLHPGLADAIFQLCFNAIASSLETEAEYLVSEIQSCVLRHPIEAPEWGHVRVQVSHAPENENRILTADLEIIQNGEPVVVIKNATLLRADLGNMTSEGSKARARPRQHSRAPAVRIPLEPWLQADAVQRSVLACDYLRERVAAIVRVDPSEIQHTDSFFELGLDSLMALELKDVIGSELGVRVSLVDILRCSNLDKLAATLSDRVGAETTNTHSNAPAVAVGANAVQPGANGSSITSESPESFPLTDLQEAYLVGRTDLFELGNVATIGVFEIDLEGTDAARAQRALNATIRRHGMLRACIEPDGTSQRVLSQVPDYVIAVEELHGLGPAERQQRLAAIRHEMRTATYDPSTWPTFDIRFSRLAPETLRLHVGVDALFQDAKGTANFFTDWVNAYQNDLSNLPPLSCTFGDYVREMKAREAAGTFDEDREYWRKRIDHLPAAPELPTAKRLADVHQPKFRRVHARLERSRWQSFQTNARSAGVTPSVGLLAAYARVLATWATSPRFILNTLAFNRAPLHPDVEHIVANFSSTILVEINADLASTQAALATSIQHQLWSDMEHGSVSGVWVLRELNRKRRSASAASAPYVFTSTLPLREARGAAQLRHIDALHSLGNSGVTVYSSIQTPQVCLDHQALEEFGELLLNWDVVDEVFPDGLMDAMFSAYIALIELLASDVDAWQRAYLPALPNEMLRARLQANATEAPIPSGLLHDGFVARAKAQPTATAVSTATKTLSYKELDELTNGIADELITRDLPQNAIVGVVMRKGWQQVAAVLGCAKAGVVYLPIDADLPRTRIEQLLSIARARMVLSQRAVAIDPTANQGEPWLRVEDVAPSARPSSRRCQPNDLAYVIFTSGTTGVPKGVMIEHRAALNTVIDVSTRFDLAATDHVYGLSALSFDLSVFDVFGTLGFGGTLVIPVGDAVSDPACWLQQILSSSVTVWNTVPALMELLVDHCEREAPELQLPLRCVMLSGDWIPVSLPERIRRLAPNAVIYSLGGATEVSIWSVYHRIQSVASDCRSVPYGRPLANQSCQVLNHSMMPCPVGVAGMLYIGGIGLARGYLHDPEKTRAAFVQHPVTGERLYRTGDWARYLSDGELEFLGRQDDQVKVNGFRIELGEIDAALGRLSGVVNGVVIALGERAAAKRLVAFVVPADRSTYDAAALQSSLVETLPGYMVPRHYVCVDKLPLTVNGKVDRQILAAGVQAANTTAIGSRGLPMSFAEQQVANVLETVLCVAQVGREDNFFELGGNSLQAVRVVRELEKKFSMRLRLNDLLGNPTVAGLAGILRDKTVSEHAGSLVPIRRGSSTAPKVFCIHPVGGSVFCYGTLDHAVSVPMELYGLQSRELEGNGLVQARSLEEMAADYVMAIRARCPVGDVIVCGWSMGGVLAYEVARQLSALGEAVKGLVMVDAPYGSGGRIDPTEAELLTWFARDLSGLASSAAVPRPHELSSIDSVVAWAKASHAIPASADPELIRRFFEVFSRNALALSRYSAGELAADVKLLAATENPRSKDDVAGWTALIGGDSSVSWVATDHYGLMRSPYVTTFAKAITDICASSERTYDAEMSMSAE